MVRVAEKAVVAKGAVSQKNRYRSLAVHVLAVAAAAGPGWQRRTRYVRRHQKGVALYEVELKVKDF